MFCRRSRPASQNPATASSDSTGTVTQANSRRPSLRSNKKLTGPTSTAYPITAAKSHGIPGIRWSPALVAACMSCSSGLCHASRGAMTIRVGLIRRRPVVDIQSGEGRHRDHQPGADRVK